MTTGEDELHRKIRELLEAHAPSQVAKLPLLLGSDAFKDRPQKLLTMLQKKYNVKDVPEQTKPIEAETDDLRERIVRMIAFYGKGKTKAEAASQMEKLLATERFRNKEQALLDSLLKKYGPEPDVFPAEGGAPAAVDEKMLTEVTGLMVTAGGVDESDARITVERAVSEGIPLPTLRAQLLERWVAPLLMKANGVGMSEALAQIPLLLEAPTFSGDPSRLYTFLASRDAKQQAAKTISPLHPTGPTADLQQHHADELKSQIIKIITDNNPGRTEAEARFQMTKLLETDRYSGEHGAQALLEALKEKYYHAPEANNAETAKVPNDAGPIKAEIVKLIIDNNPGRTKAEARSQVAKLLETDRYKGDDGAEALLEALKEKYSKASDTKAEEANEIKAQIVKLITDNNPGRTEAEARSQVAKLLETDRYSGEHGAEALLEALKEKYSQAKGAGDARATKEASDSRHIKAQIVKLIVDNNPGRTEAEARSQATKLLETDRYKGEHGAEALLEALKEKYSQAKANDAEDEVNGNGQFKTQIVKLITENNPGRTEAEARSQMAKLLETDRYKGDDGAEALLEALREKYGRADDDENVKAQIVQVIVENNSGRSEAEAAAQVDKLLGTDRYMGKPRALLAAVQQKYGCVDTSTDEAWVEKCTMLVQLHAPGDMETLQELLKHPKYEGGYEGLYNDLKAKYLGVPKGKEEGPVLKEGDRVKLCNLVRAEDLNGEDGILLGRGDGDGVWLVLINGVGEKLLKSTNLRPLTPEEHKAWDDELMLDHTTRVLKLSKAEGTARDKIADAAVGESLLLAEEFYARVGVCLAESESRCRMVIVQAEESFVAAHVAPVWAIQQEALVTRRYEKLFIELSQDEIDARYDVEDAEAEEQLQIRLGAREGLLVMVAKAESEGRAVVDDEEHTARSAIERRKEVVPEPRSRSATPPPQQPTFREKLLRFYSSIYPKKDNTEQVDLMLDRYKGREDDLADALEAKYGRRLDGPDHYAKLLEIYKKHAPEKVATISAVLENYRGREADLFNTLAERYKDPGCVLEAPGQDDKHEQWEKRLAEIKKINPSLDITYSDLVGKYAGCGEQILARLEERYTDPNNSMPMGLGLNKGPPTRYAERLTRFYSMYAPEKLPTVNSSLRTYRGKEEELFEMLIAAYGPEPKEDVSSSDDEDESSRETSEPSMDSEDEEEAKRLAEHIMSVSNEFEGRPEDLLDAIRRRLKERKAALANFPHHDTTNDSQSPHKIGNTSDTPSAYNRTLKVCTFCGQRSLKHSSIDECPTCGKSFTEKLPMKSIPGNSANPSHHKVEETFISGSFLWYRYHPAVSTGPASWKKAWFYLQEGALMKKRENSNAAKVTMVFRLDKIYNIIPYDLAAHESPPVTRCRHLVFAVTLNTPVVGTKWYTQILLCAESMQMKRGWMSGLKASLSASAKVREGSPRLAPHDGAVSPPRRTAPDPPTVRLYYMCEGVSRWGACFAHVEGSFFCTVTHSEGDAADEASNYLYFPLSMLQRVDWIKANHLLPPVGTHGTGLRLQFRRKAIFITSSLKSVLNTIKTKVFDGMRDDEAVHTSPPVFYQPCETRGGLPTCFPVPSHGVCPIRMVPRTWELALTKIAKQETTTRRKLEQAEVDAWAVVKKGPPTWLVSVYCEEAASRHSIAASHSAALSNYRADFDKTKPLPESSRALIGLSSKNSTADGLSLGLGGYPHTRRPRVSVSWGGSGHEGELPSP